MGLARKLGIVRKGGALARLRKSEDGVAAIEFAILAIPFFMLLFAIIESCVAYAAEQVLDNAIDEMGRKLRTGQITFTDPPKPDTHMEEAEFRTAFCLEIAVMLGCEEDKLYLNVRSFEDWSTLPDGIPRESSPYGDLDTEGFGFNPGDAGTNNMVRAYYRWQVVTDLIRPYITNTRPEGGTAHFLIVGTSAFKNEDF